jgi:glycosyltransferase involved in cell wall biosynthesis
MRVAVWHNLPSGGGKRALVDHVDGLVARGHQVEVWSPPQADRDVMPFRSGVSEHLVGLGIRGASRWGPCPPAPVLFQQLRAMHRHLDVVAEEIASFEADVLLGGACQYFRAVDLPTRLGVPSVLYLGEPFRWLYEALPVFALARPRRRPGEGQREWARRRARDLVTLPGQRSQAAYELAAARSWDRLLVNSLFSRESVQRAYGLSAEVCYLGVHAERFQRPRLQRGRGLLGLGALVPEKGAARVLEALAELPEPRPVLTWVGNVAAPRHVDQLVSTARALGVTLDLRVGVTDDELLELMARSRALVYAPVLEPFGLAPLEASAASLPVVALAEGGVRETVVDGVTGILVTSLRDLPGALARVLEDDELVASLARQGPDHVRDSWSSSAAVDRLEAHLLDVAGRP